MKKVKRKWVVKHYWCVDDPPTGKIEKELRGTYTTYAVSAAQAESNIRFRLDICFAPYDLGKDVSGYHDLIAEEA